MRIARAIVATVLGFLLLIPTIDAKIMGVFQGKIIQAQSSGGRRYLFVQGKSGFIRKVDLAHATVEYDDDFPANGRFKRPIDALKVAANVRVTAEQLKGRWQASEILILKPGAAEAPRVPAAVTSASLKN